MAENVIGTAVMVFWLASVVVTLASLWKIFQKANIAGWKGIVPIYNVYLMLKIGNNPGWYLLLFVIPIINFIVAAKMYIDLAKAFDKGLAWGLGLWLIPIIFLPMLAFGDATYRGPGGSSGGSAAI
ncbi:DUF5684 domain-containing protein [Halorussus pelagicus]|uniref:DUF5684 domain-containing protein n=1 Tax=Halorussus pelagicus TaxID=2505977 RepID=UPI001FB61562|nr:DUF5684 domain-containing protein [Halorussus pelagicus]